MLKRENYTGEHIAALRASTGADPSILERTVIIFLPYLESCVVIP